MTPEQIATLVAPYEALIRQLTVERFNLLQQLQQQQQGDGED